MGVGFSNLTMEAKYGSNLHPSFNSSYSKPDHPISSNDVYPVHSSACAGTKDPTKKTMS